MQIDPSSECSTDQTRRRLLQLGGSVFTIGTLGVSSASATTSPVAGSGGSEIKPDFDGYLQDVDGGYEDRRGESEVTVEVGASGNGGNVAFGPAGIWIDPGTTVVWEWTGDGGCHEIEAVEGPASFKSENVCEEGFTFEHTFGESEAGITNYQCRVHDSLGMLGAVAVGEGVPTVSATTSPTTGGGGSEIKPDFGGHLQGVDGGYEEHRGVDEVTVEVGASGNGGNLAFSPAGIWIDPETTVVWEWTGKGGCHEIEAVEGPAGFKSEIVCEEGFTFEHTFGESEAGITNYQCNPHASLGMLGAIAVGEGVPTVGGQSTNETSDDELNESEIPLEPPEEEVDEQTQTTGESTDNESTDDGATESGTSTSVPGFGVLSSLTALGGVGYLIERRLKTDQSNK